jgi:hypothetical protein
MNKNLKLFGNTFIFVAFIASLLNACKRDLDPTTRGKEKNAVTAAPWSVFTTQRPALATSDNPVELGMKFKSSTSGTITKFRYYKVAGETGAHTGRLWSAGGTLLNAKSFTAETDTGWQTVALDTPYHINAGTTYVVSVNAVSKYAATYNELDAEVTNGPLTSIAGSNGVYIYKPGSFPVSSYNNTNYYRDVEFVQDEDDPTAPSAPANLTASNITNSSVSLSWSASTDNVGVTGYDVYRNGTLLRTVTTTTDNISGLNAGTAYNFYVIAKDAFGNRSAASNTVNITTTGTASGITHGTQLTTSMVGPAGISISTFTDVPGGTFNGTALSGWGSLARTVGAGGETIDGFTFPAGTVVLQGANLSSEITVSSGWLVLRGSKGSLLANHPVRDGGGVAALYCELTAFNTGGRRWDMQPAAAIVHRCYFPHSGLENVYSDNVTVTECWITPDPAAAGTDDHIDCIQTWGGQSHLNFSRNRMEFNGPYTHAGAFSGMVAMYSDGDQKGNEGYDHVTVTGNRWKWNSNDDKDYTGAVYRNTSWAIPDYKSDGNHWSDNKWIDGPYVNWYLLPNNNTSQTEY